MTEKVRPRRIPKPLSGPLERRREGTVDVLKDAFEHGVVNLEEYEERIALATTASSEAELDVLTRDVSMDQVGESEPAPVPETAIVPKTQAPLRAVFGSLQQVGQWTLVPEVSTRAVFGEVRLDLSQVRWVENQAHIECKSAFGKIVIVVPDHVYVDCSGTGVFGEFVNRTSSASEKATHRLTVSGSAVFGSVEVVRAK